MLRRLLGSEFQTVGAAKWTERSPADLRLNPGNFEQFFRRWAKNTQRLINMQNRGQIWRKSTLEMTESQNSQFVLNTKLQRQPVKLSEHGCNMLMLSLFSDETGRTVLNSLKTIYLIRSDTSQCRITKIKTRGNNRINKTSSRFFSQARYNWHPHSPQVFWPVFLYNMSSPVTMQLWYRNTPSYLVFLPHFLTFLFHFSTRTTNDFNIQTTSFLASVSTQYTFPDGIAAFDTHLAPTWYFYHSTFLFHILYSYSNNKLNSYTYSPQVFWPMFLYNTPSLMAMRLWTRAFLQVFLHFLLILVC